MKLADLWSRRSLQDLRGDNPELLHQVVKPFLQNLHQDLIIYREKNIVLAKLSEIDIPGQRFGARAEVECMICHMSLPQGRIVLKYCNEIPALM